MFLNRNSITLSPFNSFQVSWNYVLTKFDFDRCIPFSVCIRIDCRHTDRIGTIDHASMFTCQVKSIEVMLHWIRRTWIGGRKQKFLFDFDFQKFSERKMSFAEPKTVIQENDTVILYLTVQSFHAIDVIPYIKNKKNELVENVFQTSFGALKVRDLIGVKYGSKVCRFLFEYDEPCRVLFINLFILFFAWLIGNIDKRMGLCATTNTGSMDTVSSASYSNHLHTGH